MVNYTFCDAHVMFIAAATALSFQRIADDSKGTFVTSLLKKGNESRATNYRPVSLKFCCCKDEHILQPFWNVDEERLKGETRIVNMDYQLKFSQRKINSVSLFAKFISAVRASFQSKMSSYTMLMISFICLKINHSYQ